MPILKRDFRMCYIKACPGFSGSPMFNIDKKRRVDLIGIMQAVYVVEELLTSIPILIIGKVSK